MLLLLLSLPLLVGGKRRLDDVGFLFSILGITIMMMGSIPNNST